MVQAWNLAAHQKVLECLMMMPLHKLHVHVVFNL